MIAYSIAPLTVCPVCSHEFIEANAVELGTGSSVRCPMCQAKLVCVLTEPILSWQWVTAEAPS
jgi:hypothetical protein